MTSVKKFRDFFRKGQYPVSNEDYFNLKFQLGSTLIEKTIPTNVLVHEQDDTSTPTPADFAEFAGVMRRLGSFP